MVIDVATSHLNFVAIGSIENTPSLGSNWNWVIVPDARAWWTDQQHKQPRKRLAAMNIAHTYINDMHTLHNYTYIHTYIHTSKHAFIHACTHANMKKCMRAYKHSYILTHAYKYTLTHTYINTCIQTYIHTYIT